VSCLPVRPCGDSTPAIGMIAPPSPGQRPLRRRVGEFHSLLADLIARVGKTQVATPQGTVALGRLWDLEGDPSGRILAELWAYVAETVAAYSELTANEAYIGTAGDWTDLQRIAALVGFRPRPGVAAQGWVRFEIDSRAEPVVPAGTGVQAPGSPPQTFEVAADTGLHADWAGLTAGWPLPDKPALPAAASLRLLADPGLTAGDRVLFAHKTGAGALLPKGIAVVDRIAAELGTFEVTFDRGLSKLVDDASACVAYQIRDEAGSARRIAQVLRIPATGSTIDALNLTYTPSSGPIAGDSVVLDRVVANVAPGDSIVAVDWSKSDGAGRTTVKGHQEINWQVSPGSPTRASQLNFDDTLGVLSSAASGKRPVTVYLVGPELPVKHFPLSPTALGSVRLRLFPAPEINPLHVAVHAVSGWQVLACTNHSNDSTSPPGMVVSIAETPGDAPLRSAEGGWLWPGTANVARVHHGVSRSAMLGSGDATLRRQRMAIPDAPVAYDLDSSGRLIPSLVARVAGAAWEEVPTLYHRDGRQAFATDLAADGGLTLDFAAPLPTGRGNVTAVYRQGGGLVGEVGADAINTLLGSIPGVKKVAGAGPTFGAANQDDERRLARLAPARARSFGRIVSIVDLADIATSFPGVTHAAAWRGAGPTGCACASLGLHLAFLRASENGVRQPIDDEIQILSAFLDSVRDSAVPLCVCAGTASALAVDAAVAADPKYDPTTVFAAAAQALVDGNGPFVADARRMGEAFDLSAVLPVIHAVPGVTGVVKLSITGGLQSAAAGLEETFGRLPAAAYELLFVGAKPNVHAAVGRPK
jgi:hypothetical protein